MNNQMDWTRKPSGKAHEKYSMTFSCGDYVAGIDKRVNSVKPWRCYIEMPSGDRHCFPLYINGDANDAMHAAEKRFQVFVKGEKCSAENTETAQKLSDMEAELYESLRERGQQKMRLATEPLTD